MVKVQRSSRRKNAHCLRRLENAAPTEMEEDHQLQSDTQHPAQEEPRGGAPSSDQAQLQTSASAEVPSENLDQKETPAEVEEKGDGASPSQAKPLWKPIPPLLPELQRNGTSKTRDQICQTEDRLQHNIGLFVEPGDPPVLQQPLQTSKSGIQQIIECFRSGTSQLKHMLLKEVDTIFECKLCRSLFRGLPNLITHKEYYCLSRMPEPDGSSGDDRQSVAMKDLLDAIYPRIPDTVVHLEPIQTTNKAVFQYLTTEEELARFPSQTPSARESPVAWEEASVEGGDNDQPSQPGEPESHSSPGVEEEAKEEQPQPEDEGSTSGVEDVTISCCLCGQEFNSRRSIRRHCRKMHQAKLEELRKFTETRTVPTSLLSIVKGRPRTLSTPPGKSCPLMLKRHMRIVHKIYSIKSNRPATPPASSPPPAAPPHPKATPPSSGASSGASNNTRVKEEAVEPSDDDEDEDEENVDSSPAPSRSESPAAAKCVPVASNAAKVKEEEPPASPKTAPPLPSSSSRGGGSGLAKTTRLAVGFDFKQLFCKLCKRQFSSRQNLTKHIELHTDGNDIFIKFYRCPLCRYESRRKRDVLRHVTVVHKKSSAYLGKIMPKLESRAVKRLAEVVLNAAPLAKKTAVKEEVNGRAASSSSSSPSPPVTRKHEGSAAAPAASSASSSSSSVQPPAPVTRKQQDLSSPASAPSPPVTRKQERQQTRPPRPVSPPLTRRSEKHTHQRNSSSGVSPGNQTPHTRRHDPPAESSGTGSSSSSSNEVRVTKNFSLHACDQCGRAFAKKLYLESHKRSHRNAATAAASRRKGVSTRSKSLVW
ncbi:zinc finger protein 800b isoform X3 [Pseudoliparis swirei]|uniref:zinc finger protein 800b isoform X3 n=1 Tax=Pseudoliparis swirei TaxID=2059687 RepID=UPI0024BEDA7D|nr:zinc finger protein 800b isoform X3 [Pseudoliparis swirei]